MLKPLSEEMFTDLNEDESRRVEIIIETKLKGQETLGEGCFTEETGVVNACVF